MENLTLKSRAKDVLSLKHRVIPNGFLRLSGMMRETATTAKNRKAGMI